MLPWETKGKKKPKFSCFTCEALIVAVNNAQELTKEAMLNEMERYELEFILEEYDGLFGEYVEVVIQMGYVVMFSSRSRVQARAGSKRRQGSNSGIPKPGLDARHSSPCWDVYVCAPRAPSPLVLRDRTRDPCRSRQGAHSGRAPIPLRADGATVTSRPPVHSPIHPH